MIPPARAIWRFVLPATTALLLGGLALRYAAHLATGGMPTLEAYADAMCRWDCLWYADIAAGGYAPHPNQEGQAGWAFFPLTPLLLGIVHRLSALPLPLVGMLVGAVAIWLAALAVWPLYGDNRRAFLVGSTLLLAGPGSFYFTTGYSESPFVLFTALTFVALRRHDYAGAGLAAALLSATRLVGVVMAGVILLHAILAHRRAGGRWRELPGALLADGRLVFGLVLAPLGLFAYMAWLHLTVGDALAFLRAQEAWGRYLDWPWLQLWDALTSGFAAYVIWAATALVGLALALLLVVRRRYPESLFCGVGLVIPLSSGVISMPRFIFGQLPFYVLVAELAATRLWVSMAVAVMALGLGYVGALGWLSNVSYLT